MDVGCGSLYSLEYFHQFIRNKHYVGVDISFEACRLAQKKVKKYMWQYVDVVCADSNHLPFKNKSFQVCLFFNLLPLLGESYLQALMEGRRVSCELVFNVMHEVGYTSSSRKSFDHGFLIERGEFTIFVTNEERVRKLCEELQASADIHTSYSFNPSRPSELTCRLKWG